jgi:hypothetical protein
MNLLLSAAIAAALVLPGAAVAAAPRPATAASGTVYIIGASVTRLSAVELRRQIPGIVVDAKDGRSLWHKGGYGEPTIMEAFRARLPYLHAGDWIILETLHGAVPWDDPIPADSPWQVGVGYDPTQTNRRAWTEVVRLLPDGVCLGAVLPETNYGPRTDATKLWNDETARVITDVVSTQPCHGLADWQGRVREYSDIATDGLGLPLMYDGRHPTTMTGTWQYAQAIYWAMR